MSLEKIQLKLKDDKITPQAAISAFFETNCRSYLISNHIILISKLFIYKSRRNKFLSNTCLLKKKETSKHREKIKNIEKEVASAIGKKNVAYIRTWGKIEDKLPYNTTIKMQIGF